MQRHRRRISVATVSCVLLLAASARGGGLVDTLPEDGTWSKFRLSTVRKLASGRETTRKETITISSVGEKEVDGKPCRWIEIAHGEIRRPAPGGLAQTTDVDTFLIPESDFFTDASPLTKAVEVWRQTTILQNGNPTKMSVRDQRQARHILVDLQQFLHGRPKEVRELPAKRIDSKLGEKECTGIGYEDSFKNGRSDRFETKYEVWLHQDAPFGVVELDIEQRHFRGEEVLGSYTSKVTLVDFGKEARGLIKEAR